VPASDDRADQTQVVRTLSFDNYNLVSGETTIISILPTNTKVKKGQLVCELDPARIKDQLADHKLESTAANAALQNATLTREVAEIAVKEYKEGVFKQDKLTILGELRLALSDMSRALDRVDWAGQMHAKGFQTQSQKANEDLALEKAFLRLQQA